METIIKNRKIAPDDLPKYSVREWKTWEGRWELIEGIPFAMSPMPSMKHQKINGKIYSLFEQAVKKCPECEVFLPVNFRIDENNVVHPDLLVVCDREENEIYLTTTPDIVAEIVSLSSKKQDTVTKPKIYQSIGIKYYLLIYPLEERVKIFQLNAGNYTLIKETKNENYHFELEPCNIVIDCSKIWEH